MSEESYELPRDLLDDVYSHVEEIGRKLSRMFIEQTKKIRDIYESLIKSGVLVRVPLPSPTGEEVSCVDGSYTILRMGITTIVSVVAVEAMSYPMNHISFIDAVPATMKLEEKTGQLMTAMEWLLISRAIKKTPIVIHDGSLISSLTELNHFLVNTELPEVFEEKRSEIFDELKWSEVLSSGHVIAIPKYATSQYAIKTLFKQPEFLRHFTDRSMFEVVLGRREAVMYKRTLTDVNFGRTSKDVKDRKEVEMFFENEGWWEIYFRPEEWFSVKKMEIPGNVCERRVGEILATVMELYEDPKIKEPLPQFMADKIVKSLPVVTEAVLDAVKGMMIRSGIRPDRLVKGFSGYRSSNNNISGDSI